ncbi:unnamed protein product [Arabidopsis thaliana]|uniref:Uncharacterized protein n=1 Tax=Arabidopsis thaliana TaxID=3702 RepID=A0A654ENJ9_ARATH|nr:unnamed protein product [Arabidopsis thaliana]
MRPTPLTFFYICSVREVFFSRLCSIFSSDLVTFFGSV